MREGVAPSLACLASASEPASNHGRALTRPLACLLLLRLPQLAEPLKVRQLATGWLAVRRTACPPPLPPSYSGPAGAGFPLWLGDRYEIVIKLVQNRYLTVTKAPH